ncbi:hypothetical protein NX722_09465 [Endozoicomonas gorgoniicola]|uniref:DNA helicase n=1 Tax=Endozoicomonas gorgoniicola TaxID=1234144 RepID=A0ABT3MU18_9GAMM|nr:hypothetical protein [Endozoicomonas gorgoniicola]MCW7552867.1 hypothetical protein [Endozoicomonas gorgoniicola]
MSNYFINISGCLEKYKDYEGAKNWLSKAEGQLSSSDYESLVIKLSDQFPVEFSRPEFKFLKGGIKTPKEKKDEVIYALRNADYTSAEDLYRSYFGTEINQDFFSIQEFFGLRDQYKKQNPIKDLNSRVKSPLSEIEEELNVDLLTHLNYLDKPFFRRVQTEKGDYYITKVSHQDLSTIKGLHKGFARHLPWHHYLAYDILSVEVGDRGYYGAVNLVGDYKPDRNDLTDVTYLTPRGRSYFSSASETLTNDSSEISRKIDAENFMRMKQVIPTPSQIRAIYADGDYIIDGPAGTGKSTSLLQKLLIMTSQKGIKEESLMILVKHDGLIDPFKELLMEMGMHGIFLNSVKGFLYSQLGDDFNSVSLEVLDETKELSGTLRSAVEELLNKEKPTQDDVDYLPNSMVDISIIKPYFNNYCQLCDDIRRTDAERSKCVSKIMADIEEQFGFDKKMLSHEEKENAFESKIKYRQNLEFDQKDNKEIAKLIKEYRDVERLYNASGDDSKSLYVTVLKSIEKRFQGLGETVSGTDKGDKIHRLGDYIKTNIAKNMEGHKEVLQKELSKKKIAAVNDNSVYLGLDKQLSKLNQLFDDAMLKLKSVFFDKALVAKSELHRKMMGLHLGVNSMKANYQSIIIDEAQDVPVNFIELVSCYSKQIILAGDEAQRENSMGLGKWSNLRNKTGFYSNGVQSIFKLRHNFRQTYELGNLSYNYRQLLLDKPIEDLEADYFDNQKGFDVPAVVDEKYLCKTIDEKLKFIVDGFLNKFPLAIICNDEEAQKQIICVLSGQGYKVSSDETNDNVDVVVLNANQIAGREYPVVVAILCETMTENTIYIILSRAKFDLTLVIPSNYQIDDHLCRLRNSNMLIDLT